MPNKIIAAESFRKINEKANITKKIFGVLPLEYADFIVNKINVFKISEPIKPMDKEQLRREEKNMINKFKVSMEFDFTEVNVK